MSIFTESGQSVLNLGSPLVSYSTYSSFTHTSYPLQSTMEYGYLVELQEKIWTLETWNSRQDNPQFFNVESSNIVFLFLVMFLVLVPVLGSIPIPVFDSDSDPDPARFFSF